MISQNRFHQGRSNQRLIDLARQLSSLYPGAAWQPVGFVLLAITVGILLARWPLLWSALLLGGVTILLLILLQPLIGLGLALVAAPLGALENILLGGTILDSGQILLLLTLAAWISRALLRRRLRLPATPLALPLALFIYVGLATILAAPDVSAGIRELLKWIEISLVVLMVFDLAAPDADSSSLFGLPVKTWWVIGLLLLAGLTQALVGIWQFGLRGTGPEHFLVLGRFYRAYGTFEQPNPFGGFVNLTAMLAMGVLIGLVAWWLAAYRPGAAGSDRPASASARWFTRHLLGTARSYYLMLAFVLMCAAAASLALIFSWSRGAWLGFAAGTVAIMLFWTKNRWLGIAWFVAVTALVAGLFVGGSWLDLVPTSVVERISSFSQDLQFGDVRGVDINDQNYAVLERLAHWQAALDMAQEHPWLGVGFGNYEAAYGDYALLNWPDALGHAHNYYLNVLAETGVVGLAAYLLFWMVVYRETLRTMALLDWPGRGVPLGLLGAWSALSVHHLVDKLYVNNNYIFLGVMMALLPMLSTQKSSPGRPKYVAAD